MSEMPEEWPDYTKRQRIHGISKEIIEKTGPPLSSDQLPYTNGTWNVYGNFDKVVPATASNNNIAYYSSPVPKTTEEKIIEVCNEIEELLVSKNRKYGDSAISPVRIFSKADNLEQLKVRIDDKLSRVVSGQLDEDEAVIDDLIGYLVLYKVALR